ncbi:hypothetical protein [Streptomyces sp. NRRL S-1868]|uniref:hypothetical protein n=1 Tax=Streptomyces sp. NRRL S-1868 TaxID=1463892 RepID=UPI0007C6BC01|nr:hypothetical protein [Streptomyces sp. NRRL S-1868]
MDFQDALNEAERAGLEAALEVSGLLDAWVRPDGTALATDGHGHDVLLVPGAPVSGGSRWCTPCVPPSTTATLARQRWARRRWPGCSRPSVWGEERGP